MKSIFKIIVGALTIGLLSCNSDDDQIQKEKVVVITGEDFAVRMDENPIANQSIGFVKATSNQGSVLFSITEQTPGEAFAIDSETGELTVKDETLYDFETLPIITGKVKVSNGSVSKTLSVTINLKDFELQEYHKILDDKNVWVVSDFEDNQVCGGIARNYFYFTDGVIKINGVDYSKLYRQQFYFEEGCRDRNTGEYVIYNINENLLEPKIQGFLREDEENGMVYFLEDEEKEEILQYNFYLEAGDKFRKYTSLNKEPYTNFYGDVIVKEVKNYELNNGEQRRQIVFEDGSTQIEGIGGTGTNEPVNMGINNNSICYYYDKLQLDGDCKEDYFKEGGLPKIGGHKIESIRETTAYVSFSIDDGGHTFENNLIEVGICWSTSPNPTISDNTNVAKNTRERQIGLQELKDNTTYYARVYATNGNGTSYGNEFVFTTIKEGIPKVNTGIITGVTQNTAKVRGIVTDDGGNNILRRGVCWSILPDPTINDTHSEDGTVTGEYKSELNGLNENTTYYVRTFAENSQGVVYGEQRTFKTTVIGFDGIYRGDVYINKQKDVDAFGSQGYTKIDGTLRMYEPDYAIYNLDALIDVVSIGDGDYGVVIGKTSTLKDLNGLSNVSIIKGDLIIEYNRELDNFCGLRKLFTEGELTGVYGVRDNFFLFPGPTQQNIIDGNCSR